MRVACENKSVSFFTFHYAFHAPHNLSMIILSLADLHARRRSLNISQPFNDHSFLLWSDARFASRIKGLLMVKSKQEKIIGGVYVRVEGKVVGGDKRMGREED